MLTLGIIADTHVPDRARHLHPEALEIFREAGVGAILHAGDISTPRVLAQLGEIAPVQAVRGNRDWLAFRKGELPPLCVLKYEGVTIGLTHGHGNWRKYLWEKSLILVRGLPSFRESMQRSIDMLPEEVDVVVFGHNHNPLNQWEDGKLIFNPGSPTIPNPRRLAPSVGLLHIDGDKVEGEIVHLTKIRL